jgi:hypothetical protein
MADRGGSPNFHWPALERDAALCHAAYQLGAGFELWKFVKTAAPTGAKRYPRLRGPGDSLLLQLGQNPREGADSSPWRVSACSGNPLKT